MGNFPAYASTPRPLDRAAISTANTNRDGTGSITLLCTGAANGTRITSIVAQATVTTTAGMVRIFGSTDGGTTWDIYDEIPIPANTVSASAPGFRGVRNYQDLILADANVALGVSTHNAEAFEVWAHGVDI